MKAEEKPRSQQLQQRVPNFSPSEKLEGNAFMEADVEVVDVPLMSNPIIAMALKMENEMRQSPDILRKTK
jgi:hypothetical protein